MFNFRRFLAKLQCIPLSLVEYLRLTSILNQQFYIDMFFKVLQTPLLFLQVASIPQSPQTFNAHFTDY